jgi:hypothetical protein
MTPNRQSSAYAPYAQSPLPCCAANSASASSSALTTEYPAHRIALSLLRIKIERQDNRRTGGWPANFERLREIKDLSALAHGNFVHPRAFKPFRRAFWEDQQSSARVARRNYHANHTIFPRVMIDLMAHMAHNGTCFPPPWRTCRGAKPNGHIAGCKITTPTRGHGNFPWGKSYPNRGTPRGGHLLDVIMRSRRTRPAFHGRLW